MVAPCVDRLSDAIRQCNDPAEAALLTAELGCYLARTGDFEAAEGIVQKLRGEFSDGRDGRVTVMMMCLEGLVMFFRNMGAGALDRLKRAQFLSLAFGRKDLIAFTSAWIALIFYNQNRYQDCVDALTKALASIDRSHLSAITRCSLIFGDLFCYIGDRETANTWYGQARLAATAYGDQATIGALISNRAALNAHALRLASLGGPIEGGVLSQAETEVRSAINYHLLTSTTALEMLLTAAEINVLMLRDNFEMASKKLEDLLSSKDLPVVYESRCTWYADRVLCLAKLGHFDEALEAKKLVDEIDIDTIGADDRLLLTHSLVRAMDVLGQRASTWSVGDIDGLRAAHRKTVQMIYLAVSPFRQIPESFN
jgi:tetratricopeptide (TPR) repeat protein